MASHQSDRPHSGGNEEPSRGGGGKSHRPHPDAGRIALLGRSLCASQPGGGHGTEHPGSYKTISRLVYGKSENRNELTVKPTVKPTTKPTPTPEKTETITVEQRNALKSAKSYLSIMPFSYTGLISQLEYEGYSNAAATYAADNCGANWNEQALKSAESYLEYSAFSYTGLIDQLEFEGFTTKQATYGADKCGADWNEQAAKSAASYLEFTAFSRNELIAQLEFEGFTHEQAVYGVEANGY